MNINSDILEKIEGFLNEKLVSFLAVSGGCIANSLIIKTASNNKYFVKTLSNNPSMFLKEANGLKELTKANAIRIPKVLLAGNNFLLLENINQGAKSNHFFEDFGNSLAQLHNFTSKEYGFFEDNFIGASPQYNIASNSEKTSWAEFYFHKRLLPQFHFAKKNGYATTELSKGISLLENKIDSILKDCKEAPTLLHGDLWGGNYLCDDAGNAVLFDPAVYYGHREADLAMTKMFGGFTSAFYHSYQETYPLIEGWQYREDLYLLYHYLNHLNLFGRSYYSECIRIINKYVG